MTTRGRRRLARTAAALALAGTATLAAAEDLAQGRALFNTVAHPPCGLCHTLKDAGATGSIGPVLDELQPDAVRVANALRTGIGAMPSYKATLDETQLQALARYVAKASGGAN